MVPKDTTEEQREIEHYTNNGNSKHQSRQEAIQQLRKHKFDVVNE